MKAPSHVWFHCKIFQIQAHIRGFVNVVEWIFQGDSAAEFSMLTTLLPRTETCLIQEGALIKNFKWN
jgi:hypothetical protein